jgi:hypothetical protein
MGILSWLKGGMAMVDWPRGWRTLSSRELEILENSWFLTIVMMKGDVRVVVRRTPFSAYANGSPISSVSLSEPERTSPKLSFDRS